MIALFQSAVEVAEPTLTFQAATVGVVLSIVGALRWTPLLSYERSHWTGVIGIVVGTIMGIGWTLTVEPIGSVFLGAVQGLLAGASAVGLHSAATDPVCAIRDDGC